MSRLSTLSVAAIKAMFSPDSDDILITLLTIPQDVSTGVTTTIRLADNYTGRLSETSQDVVYGVTSAANDYVFLPFEISLPTDDASTAPRCTITFQDVTQYLIPYIRNLTGAPTVNISMVLKSTPNVTEITFDGFKLTNVTYNANTITADLSMPIMEVEPFPAHSFTPAYFPGLF